MEESTSCLWRPTPESLAGAPITRYLEFLAGRGIPMDSYPDLWRWSVAHLPEFWASLWDFFELDQVSSYDEVLADSVMPGAQWFTGARLNFAERCLANAPDDKVAIVAVAEQGRPVETTYGELRQQVANLAATLRRIGVTPGDHVAGYLPNIAEAVVALLATTAIGAVWTSAAPEMGTPTVLARLDQVQPVVLFAARSYQFAGQGHDRGPEIDAIVAGLPSIRAVIGIDVTPTDAPSVEYVDWAAAASGAAELVFDETAFDHPLWVLWSSGTTGRPKGIVQGHGGITMELLKALALGCDLRETDRFFFVTSTGWMVWNLLVGGLLLDATIVCYDGSPQHPDLDGAWGVAEASGATMVGVGAAYLIAGQKGGSEPAARHGLHSVRAVLQTGSTLPDDGWRWVCEQALPGVWLQSISGGTDVCSALAGASALLPVRTGRIPAAALGCDLQAWDGAGRAVVGEQGELVICQPMPSMPLCFVDDADGVRHHESYFSTYPGVWRHGDWVTVHDDGSISIAGRSDATLNRMGVRLGSADIYGVVDGFAEIADSLVIGMEEADGGYYLPLFVVLSSGARLDDELRARVVSAIRRDLSPRHVPDEIVEIAAVPRTLTGKRLEIPVKRILQGHPATAVAAGSISHPEMLGWFADYGARRAADRMPGG